MKRVIVLIAFVCSSLTVADTWHTSTIETVYPLRTGDFVIIFTDSAAGCGGGSGTYHYVNVGQYGMTAEGARNLLSVALTAATLGKSVKAYYNSARGDCAIDRMRLSFD